MQLLRQVHQGQQREQRGDRPARGEQPPARPVMIQHLAFPATSTSSTSPTGVASPATTLAVNSRWMGLSTTADNATPAAATAAIVA